MLYKYNLQNNRMYLKHLLTILPLLVEWHVADANCGRVGIDGLCYGYLGVSYTDCQSFGGGHTGGQTQTPHTLIDCRFNQKTSFTTNSQKFEAPEDVVDFVITELSIPDGILVQIGRVTCSSPADCKILKLTSEAEAPIVFRLRGNVFRIHATGDGVLLSFTCNSNDRQCTKVPSPSRKRMVNGDIATPHEFPFMARLVVYFTNNPSNTDACNADGYTSDDDTQANCASGNPVKTINCGGSIIHKNWILTAAHCAAPFRFFGTDFLGLLGVLVIVGDHIRDEADPNRRLIWVPPSRVTINSVNRPTKNNNDIALLKVRPSIDLDEASRYPICLPPSYMSNVDLTEAEAIAAGWGSKKNGEESKELRKGNFDIISNAACQAVYSRYGLTITENMMCIFNNGTHPCFGDGGGPAFCASADSYYYELGILSFASKNRETVWNLEEPSGSTRVTKYVDWIKDSIFPDELP